MAACALSLCGCFQTGRFVYDIAAGGALAEKAIDEEACVYHGTAGPLTLWVEGKQSGAFTTVAFDTLVFPSLKEQVALGLGPKDAEELKASSERALRDFFGSSKDIFLVVMKKVDRHHDSKSYLLDARMDNNGRTAAEVLVSGGHCRVDRERAKSGGLGRLMKLQEDAQRAGLGIWRAASAPNPNWP